MVSAILIQTVEQRDATAETLRLPLLSATDPAACRSNGRGVVKDNALMPARRRSKYDGKA